MLHAVGNPVAGLSDREQVVAAKFAEGMTYREIGELLFIGADMSAPAGCQLTGRWRIVEADLWDRGYLDLSGPAMITIGEDNNGEIAFGALQAGLDLSYSPSMVFSTTARSRSLSPITTATRLPSKPTGILLQQPLGPVGIGGLRDKRADHTQQALALW